MKLAIAVLILLIWIIVLNRRVDKVFKAMKMVAIVQEIQLESQKTQHEMLRNNQELLKAIYKALLNVSDKEFEKELKERE